MIDTGTGIAEEEIERVCDRFYRCAGTPGQGSGLGLAIALRVAQRHYATLDVKNRADVSGLSVSLHGLRALTRPATKELANVR